MPDGLGNWLRVITDIITIVATNALVDFANLLSEILARGLEAVTAIYGSDEV